MWANLSDTSKFMMEVCLTTFYNILAVVKIRSVNMYISTTHRPNNPSMAVLYLTDAFGLPLVQNKL